jgi:hypothetical protein
VSLKPERVELLAQKSGKTAGRQNSAIRYYVVALALALAVEAMPLADSLALSRSIAPTATCFPRLLHPDRFPLTNLKRLWDSDRVAIMSAAYLSRSAS